MKHLLIVGARGWGREVYASAVQSKAYRNGEYDIKGFLDSKADALSDLQGNFPPIICAPENYEIQTDDVFFIAMGEPKWRKHYAELIAAKGGTFQTMICDGAYFNPPAQLGEESYISRSSCISDNVLIGKHVIIHPFCDLGHDVHVGDYVSLEAYVFLGGFAQVGDESTMHVRSTLIRHKKIGKQVEVGASSVVMRNTKDGLHVMGIPAKTIEF